MAIDKTPMQNEVIEAAIEFCVVTEWVENDAAIDRPDDGKIWMEAELRLKRAVQNLLLHPPYGRRKQVLDRIGLQYTTLKEKTATQAT